MDEAGDHGPSAEQTDHTDNTQTESPSSWQSFPAELRLKILGLISAERYRGWSAHAAVCKEWQAFIEAKNFRHITLQSLCLQDLPHMIHNRTHLVEKIWLNVHLRRYSCRCCQDEDRTFPVWSSEAMGSENSLLINRDILRLFRALSTWTNTSKLTLELSACSPSDLDAFVQYPRYRDYQEMPPSYREPATPWHSPYHCCVYRRMDMVPCSLGIFRIFSVYTLHNVHLIPRVPAVTKLVIRRQFRRQISPLALQTLWQRLPSLESIVYEPWRPGHRELKIVREKRLISALSEEFPSHIRKLSIFENVNDGLTAQLQASREFMDLARFNPDADTSLVEAFASRSCDLEHMSIAYMIDAKAFFSSCLPSYTWPNLRTLALTAAILTQEDAKDQIYELLRDASVVALRMPQLAHMVLWHGVKGAASAVIYHKKKQWKQASLTWRSTWDLHLNDTIVSSWQEVTPDYCQLQIKKELVQGTIKSCGDAIHKLGLSHGIIHPASLREMRHEGHMGFKI
ncbi:hypothetical protein VFPPC_00951 [Pochonia chlamydosporia 170]|uniref:DUF6546 domain-containing protein n=1 Tax=Pochonia chlamydosporia 170 TaxID=1380566 RepID=A0A179G5R0_METCM|nr:hypothetical protein VFPPC_00951 [Pochonia chlamydosporia 170]OAQ73162.2 hypothetical protein VFPPC_00951 [Pochonia chlamydosporia 170]